MTHKDTRRELVAELETLAAGSGASKRRMLLQIAEAAREGDFHDFKSPHAAPKMLLVEALHKASAAALARRVMAGEFDETPDDADRAELAAELHAEPALRRAMGLPDPGKA